MKSSLRLRRMVTVVIILVSAALFVYQNDSFRNVQTAPQTPMTTPAQSNATDQAATILTSLDVKGRAPKTGYTRDAFGGDWAKVDGYCDSRNVILHRDMTDVIANEKCQVTSGTLNDPYTGKVIHFTRGEVTSQAVQIDHVVAVSNAWQTGAQGLSLEQRKALYNDPLELLAVDGPANNQKSDGDAATWLPPNKSFRCQYVARQIAVKKKYSLWVTPPEKQAMQTILANCPGQTVPNGALGKQS